MALIDRGRVMADYLKILGRKDSYKARYEALCRAVDEAPAVDAAPVVHGHVVWKNRFMGGFVPDVTITDKAGEKHTGVLDTTHYEPVPYCSECGKELGLSSLAYCPNCGAKTSGNNRPAWQQRNRVRVFQECCMCQTVYG